MSTATTPIEHAAPPESGPRALFHRLRHGDEVAHLVTLTFAALILLITTMLVFELWIGSGATRGKFGFSFFWSKVWDPIGGDFGAIPFIYGTLVTSLLALLIAVPLGLAAAVFLDAFVVRTVMLPAALELLGATTWKLPDWLDRRLPRVNIEGSSARAAAEPAEIDIEELREREVTPLGR